MSLKKQGLQKFTNKEAKIRELFSRKLITKADIKGFTELELKELSKIVTDKMNNLKGVEKDDFLEQIDGIIQQTTRNEIWEINHSQITWAISNLMQDYGRMPSKGEIATKAELSRQTVHKHLKEYHQHPLYIQQVENYKFMASKVLAKVFKFAVNGDIRAAKLYFQMVGNLNYQSANSTLVQQQNNYIQINSTVLSQENIKQLSPEQLTQFENIIKMALPEVTTSPNKH